MTRSLALGHLVALSLLALPLLPSAARTEDLERIERGPETGPTPQAIAAQRAALARFVAGAAHSTEIAGARAGAPATEAAHAGGETQSVGASYLELLSPGGITGFGASVTGVGDVNRDGYADFMVTTANAGGSGWGVYLYWGGEALSSTPGWQSESFGYPPTVAAAGDVNGDTYDDVIFSYGSKTSSMTGLVEVRYGSPSGLNSGPNFLVVAGGSFGACAAAVGDVNSDGLDDIVVGAPFDGNGRVYVYYGSYPGGLNSANRLILDSPAAAIGFGLAVAGAGDVNGDNFPDVLVGAPDGHGGDGAVYLYSDLYHANASPQQTFNPPSSGFGDFGAAVGPAGDVNGDGYADVMIGDPKYTTFELFNRGRMQVFLGSPSGIGATFTTSVGPDGLQFGTDVFTAGDLNADGYADFFLVGGGATVAVRLFEGSPGSPVGSGAITMPGGLPSTNAVAMRPAGDVNGDGFGDLVVGLPNVSGSGRVRVYFGQADGMSTTPIAQCFGGQSNALAGWSTAIGDVTGDGYDDLVVGMPTWDSTGPGGTDAGAIALYLGGPSGLSATPDYFCEGIDPGGGLGGAVSAGGDENGDGIGDLIVGASAANQVYLWYGRSQWIGTTWNWQIVGAIGGRYGYSVAWAGDVNGDGYADFLIGAPEYDRVSPPVTNAGHVSLLLGGVSLSISLWHPVGTQAEDREGTSVASAGDVNRDGYSDIVIGTGSYDSFIYTDRGHAQLFLGQPSGPSVTPSCEWIGDHAYDRFGDSVAGIGDYDGDGYGDVAIGEYNYPGGGRVYVESGATLSPIAWFDSPQAGAAFGWSVAPAGDVNGDGKSDFVTGAVFFDGVSGFDDGRASVFVGGSPTNAAPWAVVQGTAFAENVGHAVAGGGDVNGDGFGDIAVGAPRAVSSLFDEGVVRVYAGNSLRPAIASPVKGRARRAQMRRPDFTLAPLATYDRSSKTNQISLAMNTASPAGREPVAMGWQIFGLGGSTEGLGQTSWEFMHAPTESLAGAVPDVGTAGSLAAGTPYGWRVRPLAHSPYFRYGPWFAPQGNGRLQWDFRTAPADVGVADAGRTPAKLELSAPWPNPARTGVSVELALPRAAATRLVVRDLQGRRVRTLEDRELPPGRRTLRWDGRGEDGAAVGAGIYFFDLTASGERATRRVAIVR